MWIVLIIVICITIFCVLGKLGDNTMDNMGITDSKDEDNIWWTIGMLSDIYNKKNK